MLEDSEWIVLHLFILHQQYIIVGSAFPINLLVLHQQYIIIGSLICFPINLLGLHQQYIIVGSLVLSQLIY